MGTLRGSYGSGKEGVLRSLFRTGVSGQFAAIYSKFMPLDMSMCTSTVQAREICVGAAGASNDCALVAVAVARETLCFGAPKSTFRDRCKGSELLYFEKQFSWQVQHFGHGGDPRGRAQIS